MKVYEYNKKVEGYASLSSLNIENTFVAMKDFDGRRYCEKWIPLEYTKYSEDINLPLGDNPHTVLERCIISEKAMSTFESYIGRDVEFLPVYVDGVKFYMMNPTEVIECFDWENSKYETFAGKSKKIMLVEKYVFDSQNITNMYIFRVVGIPKSIFVTDKFVDLVEKSGLKGFGFELVWDSENE